MALDSSLTPEEQRFFETGVLQPGMKPEAPANNEPPVDPLALAALGQAPEAPEQPAPPVVKPPVATPPEEPAQQHTVSEATEILRRSLAEAQQRVGALEQYVQTITQQKPADPETAGPDPADDPLGAMMHKLESLNKQVADLQANIQGQQSQQTQQQQFQVFQQQVRSLRDEFVKTHPDFGDAYTHLRNGRIADLRSFGYNDQQINSVIFQEEATLADAAIRNARNPAEVIYEMAQRHGYAPKALPQTPVTQQKPDAKLQSIAAAQAASKALPRTPVQEDLTIEGLKDASDADLNKLILDPKTWAKIVGSDQYPL